MDEVILVVQLLISHCQFGTLTVFMATTAATRVSCGGEKSHLSLT